MALFKIEKGSSINLKSNRQNTNEGYCYFTTDEGKMYIDIKTGINTSNDPSFRVALNAEKADKLNNVNTTENIPVYFKDGLPVEVTKNYLELDSTNKALIEDVYFTNIHGNLNGNATSASKLNLTEDVGAVNVPVYFQNGIPVPCNELKTETLTINVNGSEAGRFDGSEPVSINIETQTGDFLPLTAGEDYKISGPLGFTETSYGPTLPESGFNGQLFFLEDTDLSLPKGGSAGQVLVKTSSTDGDAEWKEIVALPKGGIQGQALIKDSDTDGDAVWTDSSITWTNGTSAGPIPKIFGIDGNTIPSASASVSGVVTTGAQTFNGSKYFNNGIRTKSSMYLYHSCTKGTAPSATQYKEILFKDSTEGDTSAANYGLVGNSVNTSNLTQTFLKVYNPTSGSTSNCSLYVQCDSAGTFKAGCNAPFYGAVWNDYAEFRAQKEIIEPGYCVASTNNGQVYKTTEKFQACDGIVSDTFGFSIGETDECKTPLAVAGRVLAYCEGNRYDYHSGDTVCAGPDGKVCKMTREEVHEWPDRIVGIVSEIPEYEIWGDGNVPVNGRIWIKVK